MKREIEFRAWDKEKRCWIENFMSLPLLAGLDLMFHNVSDVEIMQYIGLNDKHGTKVFEGDIVKAILINEYSQHIEVIEEVTIHEGHLAPFYTRVCYEEEWWKDRLLDGFEVVGNIYESPSY